MPWQRHSVGFRIQYRKNEDDPQDKWVSLDELAKELPKGHWMHSQLLSALDASCKWGILPSVLGICRKEDNLTYMTALVNARNTMNAVDEEVRKKEQKQNAR